jgi:hypothetical protein
MRWLQRVLASIGLGVAGSAADQQEEVLRSAFRLGRVPWWEAGTNQVLVRYLSWQAVQREFSFALVRGWYMDFVYSRGEQYNVGRMRTRAIAEAGLGPPYGKPKDPVEVMWMRPLSASSAEPEVVH